MSSFLKMATNRYKNIAEKIHKLKSQLSFARKAFARIATIYLLNAGVAASNFAETTDTRWLSFLS
jgi:hypothetical protein